MRTETLEDYTQEVKKLLFPYSIDWNSTEVVGVVEDSFIAGLGIQSCSDLIYLIYKA